MYNENISVITYNLEFLTSPYNLYKLFTFYNLIKKGTSVKPNMLKYTDIPPYSI